MRIPGLQAAKNAYRFIIASPARMAVVGLAFAAGGAAGVAPGDVAYKYTWVDHRFCDDCHVHDYANEAYERSVHFGLTTCHDCHRVPIRHYPKNLYMSIFDRPQSALDIHPPDVESVICEQCHAVDGGGEPLTGPMSEEIRKRVVKIDSSPLHIVHLSSMTRDPGAYRGQTIDGETGGHGDPAHTAPAHGEPAAEGGHGGGGHGSEGPEWDKGVITCMDCHGNASNRAHKFEAGRENCTACHGELKVGDKRFDSISCQECHFYGFAGARVDEHGVPEDIAPAIGTAVDGHAPEGQEAPPAEAAHEEPAH